MGSCVFLLRSGEWWERRAGRTRECRPSAPMRRVPVEMVESAKCAVTVNPEEDVVKEVRVLDH
jgi:hypothetical protein